jgi:hypothetical protein
VRWIVLWVNLPDFVKIRNVFHKRSFVRQNSIPSITESLEQYEDNQEPFQHFQKANRRGLFETFCIILSKIDKDVTFAA